MQGSSQETWTVASILKTTAKYLQEKGCETPLLDAQVLLSHVLDATRVELYTGSDRPLVPVELERYRDMVRRRAAGEPAAYLVGHKEFYSLDFAVGPGVLVPRPETEFLVSAAIEEAKIRKASVRVADIGTGSGCVAVSLAVFASSCEVVATERSTTAAEFARKNVIAHDVQERVTVVEGELFEPLRRMGLAGRLDMVVSNPPYISEHEFDNLPVSVRDYEPRDALVAGENGTEYHKSIIREAPDFLAPGGLLALEVGAGQFEKVAQSAVDTGGYSNRRALEDYGGIKRIFLSRRK